MAVIGGLLLSTPPSLLFVPSLFSVIVGVKHRGRRLPGWAFGANRPQTG